MLYEKPVIVDLSARARSVGQKPLYYSDGNYNTKDLACTNGPQPGTSGVSLCLEGSDPSVDGTEKPIYPLTPICTSGATFL